MNDVFISYAMEDRSRVKPVVDSFKAQGWSVFWDHDVPSGRKWDEVLHAELGRARCVVVLWSRNSVESEWVHHEAAVAKYRRILVSAVLDADVATDSIPVGFRQGEAVRVSDVGDGDPGFGLLVSAVGKILSGRRRIGWISAFALACAAVITVGVEEAGQVALLNSAVATQIKRIEYGKFDSDEYQRLGASIRNARTVKLLIPDANTFTQPLTNDLKTFFEGSNVSMKVIFATDKSPFYQEMTQMMFGTSAIGRETEMSGGIAVSSGILANDAGDMRKIHFRHFSTQFRFAMVIADDTKCYLTLRLLPDEDAESLRLEFGSGEYAGACAKYFDELWTASSPDEEDQRTNQTPIGDAGRKR